MLCPGPPRPPALKLLSDPVTAAVAKLWVPVVPGGAGVSSCTSAGRRPVGGPREPTVPVKGWRTGLPLWALALLFQLLPTALPPERRGKEEQLGTSCLSAQHCGYRHDYWGNVGIQSCTWSVNREVFWVCGKSWKLAYLLWAEPSATQFLIPFCKLS